MSKPYGKVAIITRTKNRNLLLERAIQSVASQSYKDYIHVILNDGGDSKALETLLKKYPNKNRLVIHNRQSNGLVKALNQAVISVESEYVCFLDDDDTWHKDRLKTVIDYMVSNNSSASVVKMDIIEEEIFGEKIIKKSQHLHPDSGLGEISLFYQCNRNYLSNGTVTYKRHIYNELGGYDENLPTAEDWDFGIRLMLKCDVDLIRTEESLFYYHQRINTKGDMGNSVHDRVLEQEKTINLIRNKYLREDITTGKPGVGLIMNLTEFNITQTVRLEGHVNKSANAIKDNVSKVEYKITSNLIMPKIKRHIGR
jgi:glycosyltransferase involved in cell wall biosynthesis